jgi:hypothetical protein
MSVSQTLAIAAHMHVLLRRKTGRVTDTEWMAENLAYALEIVRFARQKADEDQHPELREWADKLEAAVTAKPDAPSKQPLVQSAVQLLRERGAASPEPAAPSTAHAFDSTGGFAASSAFRPSEPPDSGLDSDKPAKANPAAPRYVGGIR